MNTQDATTRERIGTLPPPEGWVDPNGLDAQAITVQVPPEIGEALNGCCFDTNPPVAEALVELALEAEAKWFSSSATVSDCFHPDWGGQIADLELRHKRLGRLLTACRTAHEATEAESARLHGPPKLAEAS